MLAYYLPTTKILNTSQKDNNPPPLFFHTSCLTIPNASLAAMAGAGVTASLAGGRVAGDITNWAGGFAFWAECYNFAL